MKKITVLTTLLALILFLLAQALPAHAEMEYRFSDKDTITKDFSWGQDDIIEAIDFELYAGYPDNTLGLNNNMTRAEFAAVLNRIMDAGGTTGPNWYDGAVDGLVKAGVIHDKSGDWDAPITRLEAAKWLGRLAKVYQVAVKDQGATFSDTSDVDAIYADKTGLMKGISPGVLGADQNLLRGEAAVLLLRVAKSVDNNLPSDEELIQAGKEALEDASANAMDFEARRNVDLSFYDKLPYKRVTRNYFEGARKFMYALRDDGRKNYRLTKSEIKVAEKHNSIAIVVAKLEIESGYKGIGISRFKKIDGRWMMTQGGTPQNYKEWGYVSKVGW
ncbi:S-layer homology domain protein [Neomoorella glycerini]|uniref:S-layer homology domain protein n=1 Tax=Neomoorella glycerini TaxID=55779 RepID=A0A6I5ZUZ1_9FIRM|nr:S-layer homology domain-containing protein [Moorella glycerini]QGP93367.1 S-layer homology domain protein [Moorella glycerini]